MLWLLRFLSFSALLIVIINYYLFIVFITSDTTDINEEFINTQLIVIY